MDSSIRREVAECAENKCEYCRLAQKNEPFASFHLEHIIAKQHGGVDDISNLCLACSSCNLRKGPNIAGMNWETGQIESLYHPRRDSWSEHFEWRGALLIGKTSTGRVTIEVLGINLAENVEHRQSLIDEGVFE